MIATMFGKIATATAGIAMAASPLIYSAASAQQGYDQPDDGYGNSGPPPGYDDRNGPPPGYDDRGGPPSGYGDQGGQYGYDDDGGPPPGYDGTRPPPPPQGYAGGGDDRAYAAQDQRYSADAERWAQQYCVRAHGDTAGGAIAGGVVGAILGSAIAGRGGHAAGAVAGGAIGAVGGAAVAGSSRSGATSPGCPPGYVVRGGAPAFYYGGPAYGYAAPTWYRPWVWYGGRYVFRPYPYHRWYYAHRFHGRPFNHNRGRWHRR